MLEVSRAALVTLGGLGRGRARRRAQGVMLEIVRARFKSEFLRNVLTLFTGTTIAQAIPILLSPLMTRLFRPEDFGLLALYMSTTMLIAVGATGMYAHAILVSDKDEEATSLLVLCCVIALGLSLLTLAIVIIFNARITLYLNNAGIAVWLYLVPVSVMLSGLMQGLNYWLNRRKKFRVLALNRIAQTSTAAGSQLALSAVSPGASGLIFGYFGGQLVGAGWLGWSFWKEKRVARTPILGEGLGAVARRHRRFPLYMLPTECINVTTNQLPVLLLTIFTGALSMGYYSLTMRVLNLPVSLIAASVADAFKQRASSDYRTYGNCRDIYVKTLKSLLLISAVPFAVLFIVAPTMFAFVFGEQWRTAGYFTRAMLPMILLGFIVSPLSYVYIIAGRQREDLLLHVYMAVSTALSLWLGYHLFQKPLYVIACFALNYSLIYLIYLVRSYTLSKGDVKLKYAVGVSA